MIKDMLVMARWVSRKHQLSWSVGLIGDRETVPTALPKDKPWTDSTPTHMNTHKHMHANVLSTHLLQLHYLWAQGLQLGPQKLPC